MMWKMEPVELPQGGRWEISAQAERNLTNLRYWQRKRADQARWQRGYELVGGLWVHSKRSMREQRLFDSGLL